MRLARLPSLFRFVSLRGESIGGVSEAFVFEANIGVRGVSSEFSAWSEGRDTPAYLQAVVFSRSRPQRA